MAKIRFAAQAASAAFARVPEILAPGMLDIDCFRAFTIAGLEAGLDQVAFLVGGAGPGGYRDIISPPLGRALTAGDVLILDVGGVYDGYFCDFDRNFVVGAMDEDGSLDEAHKAHEVVWQATEAGLAAARRGRHLPICITPCRERCQHTTRRRPAATPMSGASATGWGCS